MGQFNHKGPYRRGRRDKVRGDNERDRRRCDDSVEVGMMWLLTWKRVESQELGNADASGSSKRQDSRFSSRAFRRSADVV